MRTFNVLFLVAMGGAIVMAEESLRGERSITTDYHELSHLCEKQPDKFICANCKTMVQCVKGQAFIRHCIEDHYCSERPQFGGAVCYPDEPAACTCEKANSFRVDPYDPQRFFSCQNVGSQPVVYKCPDGMEFDVATAQCKAAGTLPPCTQSGVFANPKNCSEYYSCISLRSGWLQKSFLCSNNLMYNDKTQKCEDPCNYQFVCKQEGRYPDLLNKRNYFECYMFAGKLKQMRYQCPEGYMWEIDAPGVGKCVDHQGQEDDDTGFSKCLVPDDFCTSQLRHWIMKPIIQGIISINFND